MKAARIAQYGDASVVTVTDTDKPSAGEGEVVLEVHAASLNPWDSMLRQGALGDSLQLPVTVGGDVAGVVTAVGPGVTTLKAGDKVYGDVGPSPGSGAFAEFARGPAKHLALMPAKLSFDQAAALPLVGASAVQALFEHLDLQPGQTILIHGGTGGIGSVAVQIAKHLNAHVIATVPTEAIELAKKLGVDQAIDFKTEDFTKLVRDCDAVFDTAGGDVFEKSLAVLKPGGKAVSMIAKVDEAVAKKHGVTAITQSTQTTTKRLDRLTALVDKGAVTPRIAKTFGLDQIQDAFVARETGHLPGKVVVKIKA
jgi:alcohol dehydrogenase